MDWCMKSRTIPEAGAKLCALRHYLRPEDSGFSSYSEIGRSVNMTKAALSKTLCNFRDSLPGMPPVSTKRDFARERYSRAQKASIALGTHSSLKRKGEPVKPPPRLSKNGKPLGRQRTKR
jgi:hypothetical protein